MLTCIFIAAGVAGAIQAYRGFRDGWNECGN